MRKKMTLYVDEKTLEMSERLKEEFERENPYIRDISTNRWISLIIDRGVSAFVEDYQNGEF